MKDPVRKRKILKQLAATEKSFGNDAMPRKKWADLDRGLDGPAAPISPLAEAVAKMGWDDLERQAKACTQCRLHTTRTNVVFGDGNRKASLMFVGEAPGADEDEQGLPFVGRAGQLLTKIIEAMGLKRSDVYIANCLKCRPPENRPPQPDEIDFCNSFLLRQVALIKPKVICALGKHAAQTLLRSDTPISQLRGKFFDYQGTKLMPTYHPAYLLRNPAEKVTVWKDCQLIMKELGLPLPPK
jgi:uracil-DNA glycosylase family 4